MKKTLILSALLAFAFQAFAYTQADLDNATYLSQKGIIKTQTTAKNYRLDDKILRQEVIAMALTIKWVKIPDSYKCRKYFSDTVQNDWVCRAIELAADNGIISRGNIRARPQDTITRAEALAILISDLTISSENYHIFTNEWNEWQKNTLYKFINHIIQTLSPGTFISNSLLWTNITSKTAGPSSEYFWYPNRSATRSEVFTFARSILGNSIRLGEEIRIENNNIVWYQNGTNRKVITTDGDNVLSSNWTCESPHEFNQYKMLGQANGFFIVSHTVGLCETDSSHQDILIFDGASLVNLVTKIKQKFDIQLGYGVIGIVEVKNNQIRVFGEFSYSSGCVDLGCPVYISRDNIISLGVHVIKEPVGTTPGEFEFFFNPSILF